MAGSLAWGLACARGFALSDEELGTAHSCNKLNAQRAILEDSPISEPLRSLGLMGRARVAYMGTFTEFLNAIELSSDERTWKHPDWPQYPNQLSKMIRDLAPVLLSEGIHVRFDNAPDRKKTRLVEIANFELSRQREYWTDAEGHLMADWEQVPDLFPC